jgi:hypothetical protein
VDFLNSAFIAASRFANDKPYAVNCTGDDQLIRAGVHPKIVSERMGHSAVGITLDAYSHVLPGKQEDAVRLIDVCTGDGDQEKQSR